MSDYVGGMIPIWLDLGYMVTPTIMVGLYAQYGLLMGVKAGGQDCPSGVSCSGNDIRIGLQGQYHLSPGESLNPWFGLGIGYEMLNTKYSGGGVDVKGGAKGLEYANLQGGADFKVAESFAVGPFVSFSLGQYSKTSGDNSADIPEKAMHQWLTLGVKGTLGI